MLLLKFKHFRSNKVEDLVCIPIKADLYSEFILRKGEHANVADWINNIVSDFLDRTENDEFWSDEYLEKRSEFSGAQFIKEYGNPKKGYLWKTVFLPNGTKVKMNYQGKDSIADVKHQQIIFNNGVYTPSSFANTVANNTSRNAWRDIWVLLPGESDWKFANTLRMSATQS